MQFACTLSSSESVTVQNVEGLSLTIEELQSAYETVLSVVSKEITTADAEAVSPKAVYARTLHQLHHVLPKVRHDDIHELTNTVSVPHVETPRKVIAEVFSEAISALGEWDIRARSPDSGS